MPLTDEEKKGLGVALNEATLWGVEFNEKKRWLAATFAVQSLPEDGLAPEDPRVQLVFKPVGRVAASLRKGRWDDREAEIIQFQIEQLQEIVAANCGQPIYGWEFVDVTGEANFERWADRLSLDYSGGNDGMKHSIVLFQEGIERHLDLCVWFDELQIFDPKFQVIPLDAFIARGVQWWNAMYAGDSRTSVSGIVPLKPE